MTSTHPPWSVVRCVDWGDALHIKGRRNSYSVDSDPGYQEGRDKAWETGTKPGRGKVLRRMD